MRGFLGAALLTPALASAFHVSHVETGSEWGIEDESSVSVSLRNVVGFQAPRDSTSPDDWVSFQLEVLNSEAACGFGNITLDGQVLPQTVDGDDSAGRGSISTSRNKVVVASWTFRCIKVNEQPDSQLLKFVVDFIDGKAVHDTGFSALFKQTGTPSIVDVVTDLSIPDHIVASPISDTLRPTRETFDNPQNCLEDDLAELDYMRAQLRELQALIVEKKLAIAAHTGHFDNSIMDCDSLKCVARSISGHARNAAHKLIGKIHGGPEEDYTELGHFPRPHWPKNPFHQGPEHGKTEHSKPGNHTCGSLKHGKGIGTRPHPPHFRKPHFPLPVCRYPPPPHGKPPGGPPDEYPHPPYGEIPPPPPTPEHRHDQGPIVLPIAKGDQPPPSMDTPRYYHPHRFDRRPHNGPGKAFQIIGFGIIGFFAALLITALHRRCSTPAKKAARQSRRQERHSRRAIRRAAHKQAINNFLTRLGCQRSAEEHQSYEEKRESLLEDAEDGISTTMTDDLSEFRNAADIVSDIIAAEEGRSRASSRPIPIPRSEQSDYEIGSQIGDGEELPAYEDHDGSEMSSVVADGFRYSPGSTDYTPSQSGSASDILGPDTKQ